LEITFFNFKLGHDIFLISSEFRTKFYQNRTTIHIAAIETIGKNIAAIGTIGKLENNMKQIIGEK